MGQGRRTQLGKDYFIMLKIGSLVSAMLSLFACADFHGLRAEGIRSNRLGVCTITQLLD
jgi:hypothetical protein